MSLTQILVVAGSALFGFVAGYVIARMRTKGQLDSADASAARAARWLNDRRALDRTLANCYAHWQRLETPFGVLVIRVKVVTQDARADPAWARYPNVVDALIETLRAGLREIDQLWATGDQEVTVVLPATDLDQARSVARRAEPIVRAFVAERGGTVFTAGLAVVRVEDNVAMLVAAARAAARAARATGTDQICVRDGDSLLRLEARDAATRKTPPLDMTAAEGTPVVEA